MRPDLVNDAQESGGEGESVVCSSTAPSCSATRPLGRDAVEGGVKPRPGADAERHGLHDKLLLGICELGSSPGETGAGGPREPELRASPADRDRLVMLIGHDGARHATI